MTRSYDKLGDPNMGCEDPDRCFVCLAWTRHPYREGIVAVCPDCHRLDDTERDQLRERIQDALDPIWGNDHTEQATLPGGESA